MKKEMSPFFHFNARFDPQEVMRRHAVHQLKSHAGFITNFLGVVIDPKFFPTILDGRAGEIEEIPIPANWHADIAEWGAVLRAVELSDYTFTMVELGCGWGCWMNNSGVAARRVGRKVSLLGVEGDEGHIEFAKEALEANGFNSSEFTLHRGIVASDAGIALFPKQGRAGMSWGLEPRFGVSEDERKSALASGDYDVLPMIPLSNVIDNHPKVDLLHIDIQGGEADLISACLPLLSEKIAYIVIGTHSRQIEGRLFDVLLQAGWWLEIERPAILSLNNYPVVTVDGVQGWRNPRLLPVKDIIEATGKLQVLSTLSEIRMNQQVDLAVKIENQSRCVWAGYGDHPVCLSYHWEDMNGNSVIFDGYRSPLTPSEILPGQTVNTTMRIIVPSKAGCYRLIATLIQEHIFWFENRGFHPERIEIEVS